MESWDELNQVIIDCRKCSLREGCNSPISGDGAKNAEIFFVGEAPGKNEDIKHKPFVGASGKLLNKQLERIGLRREDVYITNIVKCRPTRVDKNGNVQNRTPKDEERKICSPYLAKQLVISKPKVMVTLGRISGDFFREKSEMGTVEEIEITEEESGQKMKLFHFSFYHPAYCLYNRSNLPLFEHQFDRLQELLKNKNSR